MMLTEFEKRVLGNLLFLGVIFLGCRVTGGVFALVISLMAAIAAISGRLWLVITCFVFVPMLTAFSTALASGAWLGVSARIGQIILLFAMLLVPGMQARNRKVVPITWLFVYSGVAVVSSMDGWMPLISYMKILNFVLFLWGVKCICKMAQTSPKSAEQARAVLMALAAFVIVGSAISYFFPSIGYSMSLKKMAMYGVYVTGDELINREGIHMFSGIMNHSQTLATNVPLWMAFVICDMIVIEKKPTRLHLAILAAGPVLMYMSRSRTALVVFFVAICMIIFYCMPKVRMVIREKRRVRGIFFAFCAVLVVGGIFFEAKNQMLSRWLRKSDDVAADSRSLTEAVTESRMGLVDLNLRDFRKNPILGMGFQVMDWHKEAYQAGHLSLLSAPIEKGVLPLMVFGECGIVGGVVFAIFLISFYVSCKKYRLVALGCLFTALLAGNMSEASFFSPGGGTPQWTATVIGGFCIDVLASFREERARRMQLRGFV